MGLLDQPQNDDSADVLIKGGRLLRDDMGLTFQKPGWVTIKAGVVRSLGEGEPSEKQCACATRVIDAAGRIVMPGLVNGHTHLVQSFMRSQGTDLPLNEWLSRYIQPLQAAMTPRDVELASLVGLIENLHNGVTTVVEHQKMTKSRDHVEATLHAAEQVGSRILFARGWRDSGARMETPDQIEAEMTYVHHNWHGHSNGRIRVAFGPMEPLRCSGPTMLRMFEMAREWNIPTHIHCGETVSEALDFQMRFGMRPVEWLDSIGGLDPSMHLVHCVHVTDAEIQIIARRRGIVVHCPVSNARLASGVAPIRRMLDQGITVCLGTDGAASNDSQDMFETIKICALLAKLAAGSAVGIPAAQILKMATINGTRAFGWENVGVLTPGMSADILVLDSNIPFSSVPLFRLDNALVYGSSGTQAHTVMVDGQILLDAGKPAMLDEEELVEMCNRAAFELYERAGLIASKLELGGKPQSINSQGTSSKE